AGTLGSGHQDGVDLTGAGSFALNHVANTIATSIENSTSPSGAAIVASHGGAVAMNASDTSNITAAAGALALGEAIGASGGAGLASGVSVAMNNVGNAITSTIDSSTVAGDGGVAVNATGRETVQLLTVAGAGSSGESSALAFLGAGAAARN